MISFDQAQALLVAAAKPLARERVPLTRAAGRVLADPVLARFDAPAADVSMMDGYAVRQADLPGTLTIVGESFPGAGCGREVRAGEAVRIFTGGPVPPGADRVIMQEAAQRERDVVRIEASGDTPRFVRTAGSDFRTGEVLLAAGTRLRPRALVAAAAADCGQVEVWRRPRVAVLGTGDELAEPGSARSRPGSVPDSITIALAAYVGELGGEVVTRRLAPDDPARIGAEVAEALAAADVLVVAGGASVGEKDYARSVLADAGLEPIFTKVAMKPGKPVWFGRVGERLVLGLPGNPSSAMITARLFLAPLLAGLGGAEPAEALRWREAALAEPLPECGDRETFVRGRWSGGCVAAFGNQDSGAQHVLAQAELLIRRPAGAPALGAGARVPVLDL